MTNQPKISQSTQNEQTQQGILTAIRGWGLLVLTLHIAAVSLPEDSMWGMWAYTFLPTWLGWLLALLAGALIIPAVSHKVTYVLQYGWTTIDQRLRCLGLNSVLQQHIVFVCIALLSGVAFWLARLRHLKWGDGYMLSIALSYPDLDLRVVYNWQAPFTVFLHQRLWYFVANPLLGWPVEYVYATISIACGVIFVYVLLIFMVQLGRDGLEIALLTGLMLTVGSVQLFFGYVENYTIVSLLLLVTMFLAWRTVQGQINLGWSVLGLSLTNAFHPSTVFLWPGMWLLGWLCWQRGRVSALSGLGQMGLPPLLVGGAVLALMESGGHGLSAFLGVDRPGGGDGIWFVPLFETTTKWQHYTMFSAAHFIDWANVQFLISPVGIPLILLILFTIYHFSITIFDTQSDKDYAWFLGVTATMYILFTWLWNPDYGGRKDWDLFAPSAFVYTLFAGYLLVRTLSNRQHLREGSLFLVAVSLLHTATWIFANTHPLPRE